MGGEAEGEGGRYAGAMAREMAGEGCLGSSGQMERQRRANFLESSESRMQTASATASMPRFARVSIACTNGTDGVARGDAEAGTRFARWIAGPCEMHVSYIADCDWDAKR